MDYPEGWYVDPRDPSIYRYFDGVGWTQHTAPASSPKPDQAPAPWAAAGGSQRSWNYGSRTEEAMPPPGHPGTWPARRGPGTTTTPDGAVVASWGRRLLARLLDGIFSFLLALPVTGYFIVRYVEAVLDWQRRLIDQAAAGNNAFDLNVPTDVVAWLVPIVVLDLLVAAAYEAFFLRRRSATPGKSVIGLRVRLREAPGPLPASAISRRIAVMFGLQLLSLLPAVGAFVGIAVLLNYLWPIWDPAKQAWHDKAAGTNVVEAETGR